MTSKFFLALLLLVVFTHQQVVGTCEKYSDDGSSCQNCVANYHLFEGSCYIDILGCKQYNFGNICHQCQNNYILVNNLCCDSVCMEKIFSKFNQQVIKQTILNNTQILQQLIPFIQKNYIHNSTARLVALQAKDYVSVRRFALLYQFYEVQQYTTKRLIIDYETQTKEFIAVDWTEVQDSPTFANIIWEQIKNQTQIQSALNQFPGLYTTPLLSVQVKKAVLSQVDEYQILSQGQTSVDSRDLYLYQEKVIILIQSSQQNQVKISAQPSTNETQTTSGTQTVNGNQYSSGDGLTSQEKTFVPYTKTYSGDQILGEQLVNGPLNDSINLIKSKPGFTYIWTIVKQSSKVYGLINFIIIGQNKYTIIRYVISYSNLTNTPLIADQSSQPKLQVNSTIQNQSGTFNIQDKNQNNTVYFKDSLPENLTQLVNQTQILADNSTANGSSELQTNGSVGQLSPIFRRMIVTTPILNSIVLQLALVYSNPALSPYAETFYYYIYQISNQSYFYCGSLNTIQTAQVYANPLAYSLSYSDPSIYNYPFTLKGNYFVNQTINSAVKQAIINDGRFDQTTWSLSIAQSQRDRNLVRFNRIKINFGNQTKGMTIVAHFDSTNNNITWLQHISYDNTNKVQNQTNPNQQTTMITSEVYVIKEGSNVHTFYPVPLPQEMQTLLTSLSQVPRTSSVQNSSNSGIGSQNFTNNLRRMVLTTPIQNSGKYQVSLVYSNNQINNYSQVFHYYIVDSSNGSGIYCGSLHKVQSAQVYCDPWAYNLQASDPSILSYPFSASGGNYYADQTINSSLLLILAQRQYPTELWSNPIYTSESDRNLVQYKRIRIDFALSSNAVSVLAYFDLINHSIIFDQQSFYNQTQNALTSTPTTQTAISTDLTGTTTVVTNDISNLVNQDAVLQSILEFILSKEPIVQSYSVSAVQISQYQLSLEYQVLYAGTDGSTIHATVVHTKQSHQNNLINFQITEMQASQPTNSSNLTQTIENGYVQTGPIFVNITSGNTSNVTSQTPQTSTTNNTDHQAPPLVTQEQRTQQIIDYVLQQLAATYYFLDPKLNQILTNNDQSSGTVKLNLIVLNNNGTAQNYSVMVIAKLQSQQDPIIQQVKPITQQISNQITQLNPTTPTSPSLNQTDTTQKCNSTTTNVNGQEVCQNQGSSAQIDVIPTTNQTTTPSQQAVNLIQNQTIQESWTTSDGQVIKTSINANNNSIGNDTQQVLNLIEQSYKNQTQQEQSSTYIVKVVMIEQAATTVTIQYALTVKFTFSNSSVLRRYFYVRSVDTDTLYFMGMEDLPANFDPTLSQNHYFSELQILQDNEQNNYIYQGIITVTQTQEGINLQLSDIQTLKYRIYPYGYYLNAYVSTPQLIGVSHILEIQSQYTMIKWTQQLMPTASTNPSGSSNTTQTNSQNQTQSQTQNTIIPQSTTGQTQPSNDSSSTPLTNNTNNTLNPENSSSTNKTNNSSASGDSALQMQASEQISTSDLVLDPTLEQKLVEVLTYLSQNKPQLANSTLQQYATTSSTSSIQFDLYFVKFLSDTLIQEYITSVTRSQTNGTIKILLFQSNQIDLGTSSNPTIQMSNNNTNSSSLNTSNPTSPSNSSSNATSLSSNSTNPASNTTSSTSNSTSPTSNTNLPSNISNQTTGYFPVDPNQIYYSEAITLIDQDPRVATDLIVDLSNSNSTIEEIIRYIRANYLIILDSGVLRIVNTASNSSLVSRYVIYFFKESTQTTLYYQIYKVIIDRNITTKQTTFSVQQFSLYATNHQIVNSSTLQVKDSSASSTQDTDIAYGYRIVDPSLVATNTNIQNIISYISLKYGSVVQNKSIFKVEELELSDGRLNYKIIYSVNGSTSASDQFKFVVFYQPSLDKVLVLNTINLPQNSQYNQLSSEQQKTDTLLTSVIAYVNSLHPQVFKQLNAFQVKSVSKKVSATTYSASSIEYQLILVSQTSNKKYRSFVRVASNQIDMKQISFGEIVQVSLDHYRLDQFDQIFIMNYQKLDYDELHTSSNFRMVLAYLYITKPFLNTSALLGAAFKPYSLGFLYKLYFILNTSDIVSAEVYIESYSDKISLKSYANADFDSNYNSVSTTSQIVQQIIQLIKGSLNSSQLFSVSQSSSKEFLYGTLYKVQLITTNITKQYLVYHDHSTQQISLILSVQIPATGVVQSIANCSEYNSLSVTKKCSTCNSGSQLLNGYCVLTANCGALCQTITL